MNCQMCGTDHRNGCIPLAGLGAQGGGFWYVQHYLPARAKIAEASARQDAELRSAMDTFIVTADRMAFAISNGDDSKATRLAEMLGKMQYAIHAWDAADARRVSEAIEDVIRNIPSSIKTLVVETARTTGESLRAAGVDPQKVAEAAASTASKVALGVGTLGTALIIWRFWPKRRRNPRRRR